MGEGAAPPSIGAGDAPEAPDGASLRKTDASHDSATVTANVADRFRESPVLEKLNALIAGALVVSGVKTMYRGVREKDRVKFLLGSKQTMWGAYYGLNTLEKVFRTAMLLTPGLRALGGIINFDLGMTALYRDHKDDGKVNADKAIFHAGASAWGLRHLALGLEGIAKSPRVAGLLAKEVAVRAPLLGVAGAAFGIVGGGLDVALGARTYAAGCRSGDREKKILGALDMGIGLAMGAAGVLPGPAGIGVAALASAGTLYRAWRTDREEIRKYMTEAKQKVAKVGRKIKEMASRALGTRISRSDAAVLSNGAGTEGGRGRKSRLFEE